MSATETSLRVVVRARPMNSRETREGARKCVEFYQDEKTGNGQIVINDSATFSFDSAFPDTVDQETVYEKTALPLLDRIFAGFNATVLAYGQTGSGKTYTMGTEDNDGTDEMRRGIIPRLVHALFQRIMASEVPESFKVTVSMYEVYGDNVYDLLRPDKVKLNVHGDEKNCTIVNLTAVPVIDLKGALKQLATGCHYRTKAETAMNAMSSRSHAVFTIFVEKSATGDSDSSFSAKLQLVDLAGSERLKKTEAEGNRMKEGININAGLLILSQVITALVQKQKHIPYRNSVITRVLQDSLGGNSYTVFLACISPADTNSVETLSTLRYANNAKKIQNKPIVNKNPKAEELAVLQAQIKRLQKENADLRQGIAPAKLTDVADSAKITSLEDEVARKSEELRERAIKQSECIIRMNGLSQRNNRLEQDNSKLTTMITNVRSVLLNEEMLESTDLVKTIQQIVGDSDASMSVDEDQDDTAAAMLSPDDTMFDTERLPELQAELDELEKQIAMKDENRQKALETQREFIEAMQQREDEKTQLVVRVGELETEITKLRTESRKANTASKLAEERRQKLKELERQHAEDKKTLSELKKLQDTRRRMEDALKKTEEELKNLKTQRLRLLKEQRAEASKFQAFKQKHEREMAQIKSKMQKREMDAARQKRVDEQKFAVLQQRLAESNRANKALRELNQKRANRKGVPTDATALQNLIEEELEIEATATRCHLLCEELRRQRQEVMNRINLIESQKFESAKRVCRPCRKARRRECGPREFGLLEDESFQVHCEHAECNNNNPISDFDGSSFFDVTYDMRMSSVDPDVSVVVDGEEEFEKTRQKELASLRNSLEILNEEIKDSLRNETISGSDERSNGRWEKVPVEMRPIFEGVYAQAVAHMKKEVELEFKLAKSKNEFSAKMAAKASQEEKKKREDEEMRSKYKELTQNLEEAKSGLHEKIAFLLCLIKSERIDDKFLQQFESLKNQFCDIEHKIKKSRRRTTNFAGGLTPKPELKRNERARRAVNYYGNVVNSEDVTLDDSRHVNSRRRDTSRPASEMNKATEENVRRRVAMSPIRMDDETRISEEDEAQENLCNATFVRDSGSSSPANATFVVSKHAPSSDALSSEDVPPLRRKSRRTEYSLGPL